MEKDNSEKLAEGGGDRRQQPGFESFGVWRFLTTGVSKAGLVDQQEKGLAELAKRSVFGGCPVG